MRPVAVIGWGPAGCYTAKPRQHLFGEGIGTNRPDGVMIVADRPGGSGKSGGTSLDGLLAARAGA